VRTFVDTAALYALLDEDDRNHVLAADWLRTSSDPTEVLMTHSYVVVETAALVHRRLGADAVRVFFDALLPVLVLYHVAEDVFGRATSAYLAGLGERASFVDRVSFEVMRHLAIPTAFTFDRDFKRQGFDVVPQSH